VTSFSQFSSEQRVNFLSDVFIHFNQRRPGAFEAFAGNFLRRVYAEFAADGDFAGGVVEHVGRAFGEEAVALRVGVGAEAEEDSAGVVQVHVERSGEAPRNEATVKALLCCPAAQREAWVGAVTKDPLMPNRIPPSDYLGQPAWRRRIDVLREAGQQLRTFSRQ